MGSRGRRSSNRARSSRGRRSSNRARSPRGRQGSDRRSRAMHKSVCADCGKDCEVPFQPTGDRPIYCQECWVKRRRPRTEDRRRREYPREDRKSGPSLAPENIDLQILGELQRIRELLEKGAAGLRDGKDAASTTR